MIQDEILIKNSDLTLNEKLYRLVKVNFSIVSKTMKELILQWKTQNPVIMYKNLRMPQFEIMNIVATDCQESFQIGLYI